MTDERIDLTVSLEADSISNQTATRALNVIKKGDSEGFEKWERGWVIYGLANVSTRKSGAIPGEVQTELTKIEDAPFTDIESNEEARNVKEMLDDLAEEGLVEEDDGEYKLDY